MSIIPAFIPENFKGGPVAPFTLKQGVIFRNQGVILSPKKVPTVNFARVPTCLIRSLINLHSMLNGTCYARRKFEDNRGCAPVWVISAENNGAVIQK
jgi:hypothetical protein